MEGNENLQEVLSKQLYLCQCLMALEIVRTHGHFVTKLFDVLTPFSVGLIYMIYKCFNKSNKPRTNISILEIFYVTLYFSFNIQTNFF